MKATVISYTRGPVQRDLRGDTRFGEWRHIVHGRRIIGQWHWFPFGELAASRAARRVDAQYRLQQWHRLRFRRRLRFAFELFLWFVFVAFVVALLILAAL